MVIRKVAGAIGRATVPVAPGPFPACHACRLDGNRSLRSYYGELVLCIDGAACCDRYRSGASPESYAAALRGELLAVAP